MVDLATFPTMRNVLCEGDNIVTFISEGTIKAGMVVAFNTTGVSFSVLPAKKGTTGMPVGVALEDATSGQYLPVAMDGCIVNVVNADDTTDIDAGDIVEDNDNAIGGTVSLASVMDAGVVTVLKYRVGIMLDDNVAATVGGGISRMRVQIGYVTAANNA